MKFILTLLMLSLKDRAALSKTQIDFPARDLLDSPTSSIPFNSTKGKDILLGEDTVGAMFWYSIQHLVTQKTQSYCGIATSAMILNTLTIESAPVDPLYAPYQYWTQDNFFDNCTSEILSAYGVLNYGTTLEQLSKMISCHDVHSYRFHANETTESYFRSYVEFALGADSLVAVNFHRLGIGEFGGGHWSPVLAFSPIEDMVLMTGDYVLHFE